VPVLVALLQSRYGRQSLQAISLLAMVVVIADGLPAIRLAAMNLPACCRGISCEHLACWRSCCGQFFCMACPFYAAARARPAAWLGASSLAAVGARESDRPSG